MQNILGQNPTFIQNNCSIHSEKVLNKRLQQQNTYCVIDISDAAGLSPKEGCPDFIAEESRAVLDAFLPFGLEGPFVLVAVNAA